MLRRILSTAVCLYIILALVACGNNPATDEVNLSVDQIAENAIQAFQGLKSYEGSVDMSFTEPTSGQLSLDVWMDGALTLGSMAGGEPPQFRGEVTDSNIEGLPTGTVAIFAPTSLFYNPTEQVVYTAKRDMPGAAAQLYRLPMLFITTMNQTLRTLTVPTVNQTVVGKEQLGAFDTIKIEATAAPDATNGPLTGDDKTTIWIDTATNLPVKMILATDAGEQTVTVREMKVNQGVDAERFSYDPPADAKVIELSPPVTVASLKEASSQAGFTAPLPGYLPEDLPTTPTTVSVQETPVGFSIMQTYGEGGESPTVYIDTLQLTSALAQLPLAPPPGASSSQVDINGVEALILVIGEGQASLSMRQGDFLYVIRGNGFGEDEIIKVAEQLQMS